MLKVKDVNVVGFEEAIRGMRNPMNSWGNGDSFYCKSDDDKCKSCIGEHIHRCYNRFVIGDNDYNLMVRLANGGPVHAKYRRMIVVYADIIAPLYWWKEFDTYKVGTVANSCSTMHKIHAKEFDYDDFSMEHLLDEKDCKWGDPISKSVMDSVIMALNGYRKKFLETHDKRYWWQMIQLLPSSYNQRRTVMMNYEVLAGIYPMRKDHKLDEWKTFCDWIKKLPCSKIITGPTQNETETDGIYAQIKDSMITVSSWSDVATTGFIPK